MNAGLTLTLRLLTTSLTILIVLGIYGCAPGIQKPPQPVTVSKALELGKAAYSRWQINKDLEALLEAERYHRIALSALPDNVNLQKVYYSNLYLLAIDDWVAWRDKLRRHFNSVNPLIKPELSPPSLLEYNHLYQQRASLARQIQALKKAAREQPESSRVWYVLSVKQEESKQLELALYSALRATAIENDSAELLFQVGDLYDDLAITQSCIYSSPQLLKKSVQYIAKAVAIEPQEQRYQNSLAMLYSTLGLYPLSLQVAKKTAALDDDRWAVETLGQAYLDMRQYDKADEQFKKLQQLYNQSWIYGYRALVAASDDQWNKAQQFMLKNAQANDPDIYSYLLKHWVDAINQTPQDADVTIALETENEWESSIKAYFNRVGSDSSLIEQSKNVCQATEAHFYTAMKQWLQGDTIAAKDNLKAVMALKAYSYVEYMWARALLDSTVFE